MGTTVTMFVISGTSAIGTSAIGTSAIGTSAIGTSAIGSIDLEVGVTCVFIELIQCSW